MVVNTGPFVAVMIAQQNARRREEQEQEKEKKKKKEKKDRENQIVTSLLLLNRKECNMTVGKNEKVEVYRIIESSNNMYQTVWMLKTKENRTLLERNTFVLCLEDAIKEFCPKEIELIPHSVNKDRAFVDIYTLIVKTEDKESVEKEKQKIDAFEKMASDMSEDISESW